MLRFVLTVMFAVFVPALVAGQEGYTNQRFGYVIPVPEGFSGAGESTNGDGQVFTGRRGETLTVWGGNLLQSFEAEVAERQRSATGSGWHLTYQATTPRWASFSGVDGGRILYQRMIALCDDAYASFRLTYQQAEIERVRPTLERLVSQLRSTRRCD
ncbi:hypothetical protein GCM10007989_28520 [Devosia pacifica]|uniref:Uncharacterized protein n=1 Tax=Devosia pacifica TaxID=1335967 RepID=A0A918VWD0_9HYPH|nr:hypothetical protein [Devosia pacifica]GHA30886.1 hypothetical protein GCM10007989_28520 [Devosia pacifica]